MSQSTHKIVGFTPAPLCDLRIALHRKKIRNLNFLKMNTITVVTIPVTDQQKAKEFYLKLGFQVIIEAPMGPGETWLQMGLPNQATSIALMKFHGLICSTDDIEKESNELKSKGIEVGKIDDTPWGKFAWLKDSDGNGVCLHQQ